MEAKASTSAPSEASNRPVPSLSRVYPRNNTSAGLSPSRMATLSAGTQVATSASITHALEEVRDEESIAGLA